MQPGPFINGQSAAANSAAGLNAVPLIIAAFLFAGGIGCRRLFWLPPSWILCALLLLAALACVAARRAQRVVWAPLAALWWMVGFWCALMQPQPAPAPRLAWLSDNLLRTVEGTVTGTGPVRAEVEEDLDDPAGDEPAREQARPDHPGFKESASDAPTQRIDLRVSSVEQVSDTFDGQVPIDGGVRLTVRWPAGSMSVAPFQCGERVRAVVRLLPPEIYHDPGVWSRADYLLDQGI